MMIAWKNLRQKLSAFGADQRGNIALTFLLVALPVIAFVGAAVDYSRANSVKASMQAALDATALMLSKEAATDTDTQRNDNALKYFSKLFDPPQVTGAKLDASNIKVEVTFDPNNNSQILLSASAQLPAQFVQVLGFDTFTVKATSTAKWGITRLRVALVLDNTGSMADNGKMAAMQTATKNLLTQLQNAVTTAGDVYVSIIPFVKDVNVGPANYNTDWVYWGTSLVDSNVNNASDPIQDSPGTDNVSWNATNGVCTDAGGTPHNSQNTRSKCFANVGVCSNTTYTTQSQCTGHGDCSVGGTTSQSTCNSSGTCSVSGPQLTEHLYVIRHLQPFGVQHAEQLQQCGNVQHRRPEFAEQLPKRARLHEVAVHLEDFVPKQWWRLAGWRLDINAGHLDGRRLDARDLHGLHLGARHMDGQKPQHVERLRNGPWLSGLPEQSGRPKRAGHDLQLRHECRLAGSDDTALVVALSGRAIQLVSAGG